MKNPRRIHVKKNRLISKQKFDRVCDTLEQMKPNCTMTSVDLELPLWFKAQYRISPKTDAAIVIAPNQCPMTAVDTVDGETLYFILNGQMKHYPFIGLVFELKEPSFVSDLDSHEKDFDWLFAYEQMIEDNLSSFKQTEEYKWARNFFNGHPVTEEN